MQQRAAQSWGSKVLEQLAKDLKSEFPDMRGLSLTNLKYTAMFADAWPENSIGHQLGGQISWRHNCSILEQVKDPYTFEFLGLTDAANERAIENGLISNLKNFLVELGVGFAFLGNQHRLEVAGDEFIIDLMFYHARLHCYVVIELKNTEFRPEYVRKRNFYLAAVDDLVRDKAVDAPTIGVILCKSKKYTAVEYALRDVATPMGVSIYRTALPESMSIVLPSIESLSAKMDASPLETIDDAADKESRKS